MEEERIFKAYLRGLFRELNGLKTALKEKDYAEAERRLDDLIEDTQRDRGLKRPGILPAFFFALLFDSFFQFFQRDVFAEIQLYKPFNKGIFFLLIFFF